MGWESDGNGIKVRAGKWELRRGSGKKSMHRAYCLAFLRPISFLPLRRTNLSMFGYDSGPDLWADGEVHAQSLVHFIGLHE